MSVTYETREVRQSVHIVHCDGPECNQEVVRDRFENERTVPTNWLMVEWRKLFYRAGEDNQSVWHFHNLACLRAWAKLIAEPVVPTPPVEATQ